MQRFKDFWSYIPRGKKISLLVALIVFVLSVAFAVIGFSLQNKHVSLPVPQKWDKFIPLNKYAPDFSLAPEGVRDYGILPKETFVLKTLESKTESYIKQNLTSSQPINITQKTDNEFNITPVTPLDIGKTISFAINGDKNYSWTFQTSPTFKIVSSIPSKEATNVPVNAGIEITFNNDGFNLKHSDVQISPTIDFSIQKYNEKATLIPSNPLNPKTIYTVTIKKGFGLTTGNNTLIDDYVFSFQTADVSNDQGRISLAKDFQEIFPDEHLITKVYASDGWDINQPINTEVFKFPNTSEFLSSRSELDKTQASWYQYFGEQNPVNTKNLAKVLTANLKVQNNNNLQYLELPQNLDEGLYLVQFWFDNGKKVEQLWIQSSSVVGYVSVGKLQTVVWVNSAKSEPLGSSTINVVGTNSNYSTNNQGWAAFPTPANFTDKVKHYLVVTNTVGHELVLPVDSLAGKAKPGDTIPDDYWSYLYNERVLYKPNDTVNFWGVVKNRDTSTPPSQVDIYLDDNKVQSVIPKPDGSFIGKITLTNSPVGYKNLNTEVNGVVMSSSYFQVSNYVKPELKIEVTGDKKAIYAGESVNYKARVMFFDRTPASNVDLYISSQYGEVDKSQITADSNGEISFKYQSKFDTPNSYPRYEGVVVSAIKSGDGPNDGAASVLVYGSRLAINSNATQNGNQAKVDATINTLDLSLINDKSLDDPTSGVAVNQKVNIITTKTWWEKKQNGTYYDFVEKVTKPSYDYTVHNDVTDKKDLISDSNGKINYDLNLDLNSSYQVKLTTSDSAGNQTQNSNYFYYSEYQGNQNQNAQAYLNLDKDSNLFSINNPVDITVQKNGSLYQKTDSSRFLFILANRGNQEVYVLNSPELKFNFDQKYVPEVYVGSIIFNGRYYEEVTASCKSGWTCGGYDYYNSEYFFNPLLIGYKSSDSKLEVTIAADKTKYQPGDLANITVTVTKNGSPVNGASVQLTAVDEALAAIGGVKEPSILSSLYKQVSDLIYYNYYSHKPALPDGPQAERGGGGGSRDLFKDTAFFNSSTTDNAGQATFNVSLPDNITNWLLYAQALTEAVDGGQTKSSLAATKDFFVTSQFPNTVSVKDSPLVAVSSFGNVLNSNSQIPVDVFFNKGTSELAKNSVITNAFKESYIEFPKLTVGQYLVTLKGNYQNYQDGVSLPLNVISSRLDFNLVTNKSLQKGDQLTSFDVKSDPSKNAKLIVTDLGKGKYLFNLLGYCYNNSNRVEKLITAVKADQILSSRFNSGCQNKTDLTSFQDTDGGIKQVAWGGSDLETTVWAIYVDPTQFNKEKLTNYFENYNAYSNEDKILKNWGLSLLGKPNLVELDQLINSATTFKGKVLGALDMYSTGNTQRSKEIYFDILSEYTYTNKPYLRIESDPAKADYSTYTLDTSYALLLGTLNGETEYNRAFNLYLNDYRGFATYSVLDIANISYINAMLSTLPDKNTVVTLKTASQNITKDITKNGFLSVNLKSNEINNFSLKVVDGSADANLNYVISQEAFTNLQTDNRISLKKTITKVKGDPSSSIKIGDILEVDLTYDFAGNAPNGCYNLTDTIPSGMTYIDDLDNYNLNLGTKGLLYPNNTNIVGGCAINSSWWKSYTNNDSTYFLRVTAAGKFINEPATIQSSIDPTIFQKTPEDYVTVER